jgi:hypothetical protein
MSDLSAEIQLRPTRIGFLVHPADLASVRRIMRACTCLWGGVYNPIIPVFNEPPNEWKSEVYERVKGTAVVATRMLTLLARCERPKDAAGRFGRQRAVALIRRSLDSFVADAVRDCHDCRPAYR